MLPDYVENSRSEMRATRRGLRPRMSDTQVLHKNGRAVWLSWLGAWSEPVKRYFFVGRDMTESRLAQESLRESEQLARGIIDTALDAFVQMDETGIVTDWNPQAEKIFGWPRGEALGKKLSALIVPEIHRDAHRAGIEHFLRTGESPILGQRFEIEALRRDGNEIKVELSITELRRRDGIVFNGFIRDLTDKIAAEDRIRHAEKMEAVGQLTGGIAHDFNNILTVITGTIEILGEAVAEQPQLAAITRMIDEAASRGAELTQHLLAFARKQPLQPRETDVNTLIIDTAKLLRPALGEPIEIELVFEDEVCFATVDPNQLATAILNLALNARDAMPGGGKLIIETGSVFLDDNYARTNADVRPGRYAMIAVSDTGAGIPAAILDKVFDPFFTSKGPGKGTGLGLSMVYGFVKQSAGHIKIYSEEGHGTTIKMYLPPGTGAALAAEAVVPAVQGGNETILVVEDDKLVREYVLTQLQSLGYVTLDAANAAEALAIVDAGHPFDLLFTDVIMPGFMNGRQLADEIEGRRPGLKVLFTSGYTENAIIHHGRLDSGVLLLAKPYRKSDLASMIRTALGRLKAIRFCKAAADHDRAAVITIRTRSAAFRAPSFFMILARWSSMVRGLMPRLRPASLLDAPAVNCSSTSRSRRVSGSRPGEMQRFDLRSGTRRLPAHIGVDRLVQPRDQLAAAERLFDEIERAALDRADRHGDVALSGNHEDRRRIILAVKFLQDVETGFAGNVHVEQDGGRCPASRNRQKCCAVGETDHLIAAGRQHHGKRVADGGIVVHDKNLAPRVGFIGHVPSSLHLRKR